MYPFNTRAHLVRGLVIFSSSIVIALFAFTVYWWFILGTSNVDLSQLNSGLDVEIDRANTFLDGHLFLYGTPRDKTAIDPVVGATNLYTLDLTTQELFRAPDELPRSAIPADDSLVPGIFVGRYSDAAGTANERHPSWIDYRTYDWYRFDTPSLWNEGTIQAPNRNVPDRTWIAYDGQSTNFESGSRAFFNLSNWTIVVHNPATNETRTIPQAARPQWLNDGADLVYLKRDGLYRYNVSLDQSERLNTGWSNLGRDAQLAVADDSSRLLLTVPNLSTIAAYTFTDSLNGELELLGMIAQPGLIYTDPVFDVTGSYYAVLRFSDSPDGAYNPQVELRNFISRDVIDTIPIDFESQDPLTLLDWRPAVEPYAWR